MGSFLFLVDFTLKYKMVVEVSFETFEDEETKKQKNKMGWWLWEGEGRTSYIEAAAKLFMIRFVPWLFNFY